MMSLSSKDVEFYCTSFDICEKFVAGCPPAQTPTQKLKSRFPLFDPQEIGSTLVSFQMIFEALQSEQLKLSFYWVENLKNPGIQPIHVKIGLLIGS